MVLLFFKVVLLTSPAQSVLPDSRYQGCYESTTSVALRSPLPFYFEGIYKLRADRQLDVKHGYARGRLLSTDVGVPLSLERGDMVALKYNKDGKPVLSFVLGEEEDGVTPDSAILEHVDLMNLPLEFAEPGDEVKLRRNYSNLATTIEASRSPRVKKRRMRWNGTGGCVAFVLSRLGYLVWGNGKDITGSLKSQKGWRKVSCENPAVGTVASWTGGDHGRGHTAIWNGRCFEYDIACADPGRKYRLIECVAPPS